MGAPAKKKDIDVFANCISDADPLPEAPKPAGARDPKRIRKVSPLGMRVVVQLKRDNNITDGGLYLPEGAKQALAESLLAQVVEVASATDHRTDEETNISGVPLGAMVLIPKQAGVRVPWDEELRIVETKEILAVVNEIEMI